MKKVTHPVMVFSQTMMYVGVVETTNSTPGGTAGCVTCRRSCRLCAPWIAHAHAAELAAMSALLDEQPALGARVQQDLEAGVSDECADGPAGALGRANAARCCSCGN